MAIVTLPNGSKYNTSISWQQQPDTGSFAFIEEVQTTNEPTKITEKGMDPTLPRVKSRIWTETSYTGSNYIFQITYRYLNISYAVQSVGSNFKIENK